MDTQVARWTGPLGGSSFHVVVAVENRSPSPLRLTPTGVSFALLVDEEPATIGRFRYGLPAILGGGERGYLVETVEELAEVPSGRVVLRLGPFGDPATVAAVAPSLTVSDVAWSAGPAGLRVRGTVTNGLSRDVLQGVVAAVALGSDGHPLAALVDLTDLSPLAPGQRRSFLATEPQTGPLAPDVVATVRVFAYDLPR